MRFLIDQDVYAVTTKFLRHLGHDVVTASELGLHQAQDQLLLKLAHEQARIMVTRDRDYGGLIFLTNDTSGVLYLRIEPSTVNAIHQEMERVLTLYSEQELLQVFCVIEPGRHRIRRR